MASYSGKDGVIDIGSSALIANVTGWSITETGDTVDTTVMGGDGWKTNIATLKEWSGSCDVDYDPADTDGQVAAVVGTSFTFKVYPRGTTASYKYLTGSAIVTSNGKTSTVAGKVTGSIAFKGTGALAIATA